VGGRPQACALEEQKVNVRRGRIVEGGVGWEARGRGKRSVDGHSAGRTTPANCGSPDGDVKKILTNALASHSRNDIKHSRESGATRVFSV